MSRSFFVNNGDAVIVRGFGDEPVKLTAVEVRGDLVEVEGRPDGLRIQLRKAFVREFSEAVFERLRRAYEAHDSRKLAKLWKETTATTA